LDKFLSNLSKFNRGWSISLFHYRNHGHDFGRVLVGMIVRTSQLNAYQEFLDKLGYTYYNESSNPAYLHFLK
jgi:threonine dehydratase